MGPRLRGDDGRYYGNHNSDNCNSDDRYSGDSSNPAFSHTGREAARLK